METRKECSAGDQRHWGNVWHRNFPQYLFVGAKSTETASIQGHAEKVKRHQTYGWNPNWRDLVVPQGRRSFPRRATRHIWPVTMGVRDARRRVDNRRISQDGNVLCEWQVGSDIRTYNPQAHQTKFFRQPWWMEGLRTDQLESDADQTQRTRTPRQRSDAAHYVPLQSHRRPVGITKNGSAPDLHLDYRQWHLWGLPLWSHMSHRNGYDASRTTQRVLL